MVGEVGAPLFLFQHRDDVEHQGDHRSTLDHLNQSHIPEISQQRGKDEGTADHADQQHQVEQRHNAGPGFFGGKIGSQRKPRGLRNVHTQPREQKRAHRCERPQKART